MSILFAAPIEQFPKHLAFSTAPVVANADAAFPGSNLITMDPTQVCKVAAGSSTFQAVWDFGSTREFDVVSLLHSNLSYKATWTVEGSANNSAWTVLANNLPFSCHLISIPGSWTGEANDPRKPILNRNKSLWISPTVQSYRYLRVSVAGDATLDIAYTIGRLFVGKKFVPATGWQYGSSFNFIDTSSRERTGRGALITESIDVIVAASVKIDFLSKAEMYDAMYEFNYWRGSSREFLACLDVEDTVRLQKNLLYCTISEGRTITFDAFNAHSQTWILESIA